MSVVNLDINNFDLTMKCLPDVNHLHYAYTWIKKNDVLPSRVQGINSSQLTILKLKPEDSGDYQCTVSNRTGKISSNFTAVNIIGKACTSLCSSQIIHHVLLSQCLHQESQSIQKM